MSRSYIRKSCCGSHGRIPRPIVDFRREARYRFDDPEREFGVLYAAFDLETAFAETVLRDRAVHSAGPIVPLDYAEIAERVVVQLGSGSLSRPLRVIKLYDEGLSAARTDSQIAVRDHYPTTQRWARAFYEHPAQVDGIVYPSRYMGARRSVVLFERAKRYIAIRSSTPLLHHPGFPALINVFRVAIDRP